MPEIIIRTAQADDLNEMKELTILGFEPIFESFSKILSEQMFPVVYPDWRQLHRDHVQNFFDSEKSELVVATIEDEIAGLLAYQCKEDFTGEVEFLVVHPAYQQRGVATNLNEYALDKLREAGMKVAVVGTGGDESHAPARRAYEKLGYVALPNVWYFKSLE